MLQVFGRKIENGEKEEELYFCMKQVCGIFKQCNHSEFMSNHLLIEVADLDFRSSGSNRRILEVSSSSLTNNETRFLYCISHIKSFKLINIPTNQPVIKRLSVTVCHHIVLLWKSFIVILLHVQLTTGSR